MREIYFFNAKALAYELRSGSVSEALALKHLIFYSMTYGVFFEIPVSASFGEGDYPFLIDVAYVLSPFVLGIIIYYGFWMLYQTNSKGDGKQFFLRVCALSLPVTLQLVVIFGVFGFLLIALAVLASSRDSLVAGSLVIALTILASVAFQIIFFVRMRDCISLAAHTDESPYNK